MDSKRFGSVRLVEFAILFCFAGWSSDLDAVPLACLVVGSYVMRVSPSLASR